MSRERVESYLRKSGLCKEIMPRRFLKISEDQRSCVTEVQFLVGDLKWRMLLRVDAICRDNLLRYANSHRPLSRQAG